MKEKTLKKRRSPAGNTKKTTSKFKKILLTRPRKKAPIPGAPTNNSLSDNNYKPVDPASRWIIVELSEDTTLEAHYEQVERSLVDVLGPGVEYFIPVYNEKIQGKNACYVLFDGYVFVLRTDDIISNIFKLKGEHIKGPLFSDGFLRLVSGVKINDYKKKMLDRVHSMMPEKGQIVVPRIGVFKNMEGTVLSVDKEKLVAIVKFEKTSRIVEAPINIVNLTIISSPTCSIS